MIFVNHDDLRSLELMEELIRRGHYVSDQLSDLKYSRIIYLGMKGLDRKHRLLFGKETIVFSQEYFEQLQTNSIIFTMVYNEYLDELSKKYHFQYKALLKNEDFIYKNSILTAEGLIAYLISHRRLPLYQSRVLVLGFGHCAKPIIEDLVGFKTKVDVALRDKSKYQEVEMLKGKPLSLTNIKLDNYDIVINTIPMNVISHQHIDNVLPSTMIVDIASYPYGLDHHYAISKGLNCQILPSIPCKYAYGYAGQMICDEIEKELENA